MNQEAKWNQPSLYQSYLKNVQTMYEKEPVIQASVQVVLSVFAVAFFVFFAIRPTLGTISTLLRKIDDQKKVDQQIDKKIQQLITAQENLNKYGDQLPSALQQAVPARPQVEKMARQLEAISIESGAYIISLSVQQSPLVGNKTAIIQVPGQQQTGGTKGGQFVTYSFSIGGTQDQIKNFVSTLENLDRFVTVTKVAITQADSAQKKDFPLIAEGRATIYYLTENK